MSAIIISALACLICVNSNAASGVVGGMEFIRFGPAKFIAGCPTNVPSQWKGDTTRYPSRPARVEDFWCAKYPVTVEEYCQYLNTLISRRAFREDHPILHFIQDDGDRVTPKKGKARHPIGGIDYYAAQLYASWFGMSNGVKARLPTSDEWEFVAKEPGGRIYPWGNEPITSDFPVSGPIGFRPDLATPTGVFDLVGPVYQWCVDDPPRGKFRDEHKIVRGYALFRGRNETLTAPPNWKWYAAAVYEGERNQGFRIVIEHESDSPGNN